MSSFDGVWDAVIDTPFGSQKATLTLKAQGSKLTGTSDGAMGSMQLKQGEVEGDTCRWSMDIMGIPVRAEIRVEGNQLIGGMTATGFGTSPVKAQRRD